MELVLRLKLEQNPSLKAQLLATGDEEDCSARSHGRNLLWGAALIENQWVGENILGKLRMKLRAELALQP